MFFARELRQFSHHVSPAFHHKFTIKNRNLHHVFRKNPRKNTVFATRKKILKNNSKFTC
jgi:hypothetical protein